MNTIEGSISTLSVDLGALESQTQEVLDRLTALESSINARFTGLENRLTSLESSVLTAVDSSESGLLNRLDVLENNLGDAIDLVGAAIPPPSTVASQWISPHWRVLEGATTTKITIFNTSFDTEVLVDFNFYDRDGILDSTFTTSRILPPRSTIQVVLGDRDITTPRFGWVQIDASGPVLPEGELNFTRGTPGVDRSDAIRDMPWYPVQ